MLLVDSKSPQLAPIQYVRPSQSAAAHPSPLFPSTRAMSLTMLSLDPATFHLLPAGGGCISGPRLHAPKRLCRPLKASSVAPPAAEEPSAAARGRLESLSQVTGVLGSQWGDEGKGKLVDILAQRFDVVARCQVSSRMTLVAFAIFRRQSG
jgi:hypothetical protein